MNFHQHVHVAFDRSSLDLGHGAIVQRGYDDQDRIRADGARFILIVTDGVFSMDGIIAQLDRCFGLLNTQAGKTGQPLSENEWLMSIRSRAGIPGGTCGFDLPSYYAWQHRPAPERQQALEGWAGTLAPLAESIYLLLKLLRDSGVPQKVAAERGQFQQNLPQGRTFQLLRLRIDPAQGLVPEISGNRLMVSVRLMHQMPQGHLQASTEDAMFELGLCA